MREVPYMVLIQSREPFPPPTSTCGKESSKQRGHGNAGNLMTHLTVGDETVLDAFRYAWGYGEIGQASGKQPGSTKDLRGGMAMMLNLMAMLNDASSNA